MRDVHALDTGCLLMRLYFMDHNPDHLLQDASVLTDANTEAGWSWRYLKITWILMLGSGGLQ